MNADHPIVTEGDAKFGDNDDTMGVDYDVEPDKIYTGLNAHDH